MAELNGDNTLAAWQNVLSFLAANRREAYNLLVTIDDPVTFPDSWLIDFNPRNISTNNDNIRDVVSTVFPYKLAGAHVTRAELYASYLAAHDRAKHYRRNRGTWGTYFERLIRMGPSRANQLEVVISKLGTWNVRAKTALVFHPSSPMIDGPRKRGGPCWHYGELIWQKNDVIDFVVVYRNHDYFNKALGNFIALGQLLAFICGEAGKSPGKLICHSVHAFYDVSDDKVRRLARI